MPEMERAMGIEYTALEPLIFLNHEVASADDRSV
jgi:hypothetical protein